jgi:hypothetical protein
MRLPIAAAIAVSLVFSQMPRANAQAVIGLPVAETVIGIVIIGGIAYELYRNSQGEELTRPAPVMENPDEEGEWGIFDAKDFNACRWKAAGRPFEWLGNRQCKIKG